MAAFWQNGYKNLAEQVQKFGRTLLMTRRKGRVIILV